VYDPIAMPRYQFHFEAIHADWPAYPVGHGADVALETLGCFPEGTHFRAIDNIDRCTLFLAQEYIDRHHADDRYSDHHHHVAIWHEDLRALRDAEWASGFCADPLPKDTKEYWYEVGGVLRPVPSRELDPEEEAVERLLQATVAPEGVSLTPAGWDRLLTLRQPLALHSQLSARAAPLLKIGFFDSAVREAAILLESDLRRRTGTDLYGQQLVIRYMKDVATKAGVMGAFQRHLRSELRTLFMFIRNEFAHNIVRLPPERCYALLHRISAVIDMFDDADGGASSFQDIVLR
jgi:hypothetical protein